MTQEHTEDDQARIALATEMRRGIHLLVGRDPSINDMRALTETLRTVFDQLETTPARVRGTRQWEGPGHIVPPAPGEAFADSVDRPVSGSGNPFSVPMIMHRDGDAVVSTVTLGAAFEGAPGRPK